MGVWDAYKSRLDARGSTKREVVLNREQNYLLRKLPNNLSYHSVSINGTQQDVAITNSDNLFQKTIYSLPGESILGGSTVFWCDYYWLVTSVDANNEIYTKAIIQQCNHLLKWIADDGSIVERWCIVSDGTKYLTGETMSSYNENGLVLGDTRIAVLLARDSYSVKLNRDCRFLIDDPDSDSVLAYRLTKPFKIGGVYGGNGVVSFVMTEVNTEDDDNFELRIADYYKHFPKNEGVTSPPPAQTDNNGKRVWF